MIYVFSALILLVILIAVLLNISVTLRVQYDNENNLFRCTAHYLFITYVIAPEEERKNKNKKNKKKSRAKKKSSEKKKSPFSAKLRSRGIGGLIEDIKDIVKGAWGLITCVLRRSVLRRLKVHLMVAGEDAADTAVLYGYANSVIYPIVSALLENVKSYKELDVDIAPDFSDEAEAFAEIEGVLSLRPVRFVGAIIECRQELSKLLSAVNRK